jgi:hypothetical protein
MPSRTALPVIAAHFCAAGSNGETIEAQRPSYGHAPEVPHMTGSAT